MHGFAHVPAAVGGVSGHDPDRIVLEVGRDDAPPLVFQDVSRRLRLRLVDRRQARAKRQSGLCHGGDQVEAVPVLAGVALRARAISAARERRRLDLAGLLVLALKRRVMREQDGAIHMDQLRLLGQLGELLEVLLNQALEQLSVRGRVLVQAEAPLMPPDRRLGRDAIQGLHEPQAGADALAGTVEAESSAILLATISGEQGAGFPVGRLPGEPLVQEAALQLLRAVGGRRPHRRALRIQLVQNRPQNVVPRGRAHQDADLLPEAEVGQLGARVRVRHVPLERFREHPVDQAPLADGLGLRRCGLLGSAPACWTGLWPDILWSHAKTLGAPENQNRGHDPDRRSTTAGENYG